MTENIQTHSPHDSLWCALSDKDYRDGFSEGHSADILANQIFALRTHRNWSQKELADRCAASQPQISLWESNCEAIRLDSILKLASAFDVGVVVKFVAFSKLAHESLTEQSSGEVPSFPDDTPLAINPTRQPVFATGWELPKTRPGGLAGTYFVKGPNWALRKNVTAAQG